MRKLWIVECNEDSARRNWRDVKKIAWSHRGYYCPSIGGHNTLWRTSAGFAFTTETDARAFAQEVGLAHQASD